MKDETAEHKGKVYQIGRYYLFSDSGKLWDYNILKNIDLASQFPFVNVVGVRYSLIKEVHASKDLGIITPAPIKLVDGNAYVFAYNGIRVGFYRASRKSFFTAFTDGNKIAAVYECTDIRRMLVELES